MQIRTADRNEISMRRRGKMKYKAGIKKQKRELAAMRAEINDPKTSAQKRKVLRDTYKQYVLQVCF